MYRKSDLFMLVYISHFSADDDSLRTKVLGAGGHEATPACRDCRRRLVNIHDSTFHIVVDEVRVKLGLIFPLCQNHLDRDSRAEDTSLRVDRLQLYAL